MERFATPAEQPDAEALAAEEHMRQGLEGMIAMGFSPEQAQRIGGMVVNAGIGRAGTLAEAVVACEPVRQGIATAFETAKATNQDPEQVATAGLTFFLQRDPETQEPIRRDLTEVFKKNRAPAAS